jgi:hypothetical protein
MDDPLKMWNTRFATWYYVGVGGVGLLAGSTALASGDWLPGSLLTFLSIGAALYGFLVLRHLGIELRNDLVVLHRPLGTKVVPLAKVARFEIGPIWPWRVWLITRADEFMPTGLSVSGFRHQKSKREAERLISHLNGIVNSGTH